MDRRVFMKSGALAVVTMGLSPSFLRRTAFGSELVNGAALKGARGKTLICLFQRGAADALNVVVPHGEAAYYRLRPNIAIPRPALSAGPAGAIDLDGFFGLHPSLAPMKPLWDQGILAPIHAVGSPSATRSHFDAQDYMETGTPDRKGTCEAGCSHDAKPSPFRAVAMTQQTPRMLEGPAPTIAMNSLDEFSVRAAGPAADRLEALYRTGSADVVHAAGGEMFEAVKILKSANPQKYLPQNSAAY